jgi:hypothetical protein
MVEEEMIVVMMMMMLRKYTSQAVFMCASPSRLSSCFAPVHLSPTSIKLEPCSIVIKLSKWPN